MRLVLTINVFASWVKFWGLTNDEYDKSLASEFISDTYNIDYYLFILKFPEYNYLLTTSRNSCGHFTAICSCHITEPKYLRVKQQIGIYKVKYIDFSIMNTNNNKPETDNITVSTIEPYKEWFGRYCEDCKELDCCHSDDILTLYNNIDILEKWVKEISAEPEYECISSDETNGGNNQQ